MVKNVNRFFIYEYIAKIRKEDIVNYGKKLGITLGEDDLEVIYYYLKNEYKRFFQDPDSILMEVKMKVSSNVYEILLNMYQKYKHMLK